MMRRDINHVNDCESFILIIIVDLFSDLCISVGINEIHIIS